MGKQQNKSNANKTKQDKPAKGCMPDGKGQINRADKDDFGDFVVGLARKSIAHFFGRREFMKSAESEVPFSELDKEAGCFVTLTINGKLRGCIGNIEPRGKLGEAIIRNAVYAAFNDTRFSPLSREEFQSTEIEVSVLTRPEKLEYSGAQDLLSKIDPSMGLVISKGGHGATFLPQVWEELPKKEDFLSHLCAKAGLAHDEWKMAWLKVETYKVKAYKE